jgi:hypothetical protein
MQFKKSDLLEVATLLKDAFDEGYTHLVTPREREFWSERDFYLLWNEQDAREFADFKGDWYAEPLDSILKQVEDVALRYDLGEIAYVFREHELRLGEGTAFDDLREIGISHPMLSQDIYELEVDPRFGFFSVNVRDFETEIEVHLYPRLVDGKLRVPEYAVVLPRDYGEVKHSIYNGIDSRELEKKFASIDWGKENARDWKERSHADTWALIVECRRYQQPTDDDTEQGFAERSILVNWMMCTYLKDTEMERQLFELHKDSVGIFRDSVMFPKGVKLAVAAKRINEPTLVRELSRQAYLYDNQKTLVMNLNNLENLREEMANLGFKKELIEQMEAKMQANVAEFKLYDSLEATRGRVDMTLFFKQSGQSDYYYLNKFEVCHEKGQKIPEGHKIMVLTQTEGTDKGMTKTFTHIAEGIAFFNGQKDQLKEQKGISHLVVGKDANSAVKLATMEDGKVNYVQKEFGQTYRTSPINQTIYVEKGKGFSAEQAVNMIQGRAVYRDDMVSQAGQQYKAWIKLDFDVPKDRFGNFLINQYTDPAYGFDLSKVLDKFEIKELVDPAKREILESSIRNGNRPLVTVEKNGEAVKLQLEAVPRYSQINLYTKEGRPEKREQFLKVAPKLELDSAKEKNKSKNKTQGQGMGV